MRNLAIVGLKLLGILGIYWAATQITYIFQLFISSSWNEANRMSFGAWLLSCVITAAFAFALLARTDWIIAKLKFPEDPPSSGMEPSQLLRVGFVVLGAYCVIEALPEIGSAIFVCILFKPGMSHASAFDFGRIIPAALKFVLGCIVIGKSNRFARSVFSDSQPAA